MGILINNVGVGYDHPEYFHELSEDKVQQLLRVNMASVTRVTRIILPGIDACWTLCGFGASLCSLCEALPRWLESAGLGRHEAALVLLAYVASVRLVSRVCIGVPRVSRVALVSI